MIYLLLVLCEIRQTQVIDHIPGSNQHAQPVLLQQLEIVTMGSIPQELGQHLMAPEICHPDIMLAVPVREVEADRRAGAQQHQQPPWACPVQHDSCVEGGQFHKTLVYFMFRFV